MESLADHLGAFGPAVGFTALGRSQTVSHVSLQEWIKFVLSTFKCKMVLQVPADRYFWNGIIKKGSEEEKKSMPDT